MRRNRRRVLDEEEKRALLNQFNTRYLSPLRNLCMVRLMLEVGLRPGEVISLEADFIDVDNDRLAVRGSRVRDRVVPLTEDLMNLLQLWLDRRPESRWLFSTRSGKQLDGRYVRDMVKRYAKKAGIPGAESISPRILRYTYATDLYVWARDLRLVQRRLGHKYRSSTVSYIKMVASTEQRGCQS